MINNLLLPRTLIILSFYVSNKCDPSHMHLIGWNRPWKGRNYQNMSSIKIISRYSSIVESQILGKGWYNNNIKECKIPINVFNYCDIKP